MILSAISHSSTIRDCFCLEPGHFLIRLHSARGDLERVILHHQDKYMPLRFDDTRREVSMIRAAADSTQDHWEAEVSMDMVCLRYWFELIDRDGNTMYYANFRFTKAPVADINDMFDCPQNMREEERFLTPQWAENKVIYQVFPSRFASSRRVPEKIWYKSPIGFKDDLHGDLRGVIDHLGHLRELGVDILYMTPIFRSDSCHKYDTIDYYQVEPSFGTKEDLKELVDKAHALGMRVILDGVFNHTGQDFFAFADIKRNRERSRYLDWYFIQSFPLRSNYGEKPTFKTFGYYGGMPKLNLRNPEVSRYVLDVALYWLRECGIDGWRLDVGDEISHHFWKQFRREIKAEFPEALIIGEVWHYAEDFLLGDEWDTVMNYHFYQNILSLAAKEEITVTEYAQEMDFLKGRLHQKVLPLLWNLVDSHDTPRILTQCGGDKAKMRLIAALQLLSPGMPMIYYGDEYAMEGGADPDCRRGMLWNPERRDEEMFRWYARLIHLRKECPQLLAHQVETEADDSLGLLIRHMPGFGTLVFHCKAGTISLPRFAGRTDAITETQFSGEMGGYEVRLFL